MSVFIAILIINLTLLLYFIFLLLQNENAIDVRLTDLVYFKQRGSKLLSSEVNEQLNGNEAVLLKCGSHFIDLLRDTNDDQVEVVVNGDPDEDFNGVYKVQQLNISGLLKPITPFYLYRKGQEGWYEFDDCNDESELYLIRTPEGSLNKQ